MVIGSGLFDMSAILYAEEGQSQKTAKVSDSMLKDLLEDDGFVYKREGRTDPFVPFIKSAVNVVKAEEEEEELTGMRKYEPGQLNLVGIIFRGDQSMAMVQDSVGKGYIIRKGTKIGRVGEVAKIVSNRVIIDNTLYTRGGDKRITSVEMLLKQEGDEK